MTIFSIFMIVLILTITGASVDIMRFEATRAKMQSSMDRAVLAAADLDQLQKPDVVVKDYMDKAGLGDAIASVNIKSGLASRTVEATGTASMKTLFLKMAGVDTMTAPAVSIAEEKISNVEVSLILDISGSMTRNGRMDKLKPAAQDFVNKVMTDESNGVTTLNLVPFAGQVNPGDILFDYFRGERPKIKQNNGFGNGDQDAPGNSLCNNNAENATDCDDATVTTTPAVPDYFPEWSGKLTNVVFYFDTDGDDIYNIAHKIEGFPDYASRDVDDFFRGFVAFAFAHDWRLTDPEQFLGVSIKGRGDKTRYFQVKDDQNGTESDIGPTRNSRYIPGATLQYSWIDYDYWAPSYVPPSRTPPAPVETAEDNAYTDTNVNMPSSCVEIYADEFANTELPKSSDYVPHFNYWGYDEETMDWGWCPSEDMAVQYYSADRQALVEFIGNMRMHDGTGLHYGMKYGLALLDPENQDEVSHLIANGLVDERFEGRPIAWGDPETEKFIVLMTDGDTTDQWRPTNPKDPRNGDTPLLAQHSSKSKLLSPRSENVAALLKQCDLAREKGVTVFTIAFETSDSGAADMQACASSPSHFFRVEGWAIDEAFDTIARQINNLRLIQ
ncbi:pilus assembly protein TadG-related protein [Tropicibacter naphthalenivorans]|uniref:pilus assembly protein TadG-related protein n=1 Tax=Tropicibacter naphthalenivorans TaxID=441103 RepID=UPI0016404DA7|nr:pilus assembly protein TadG-related protein [Tropicibacter naphthalenivorans]